MFETASPALAGDAFLFSRSPNATVIQAIMVRFVGFYARSALECATFLVAL
ncbi:MAG: hypothetical protein JW808_03265 [Victivallales bacterium]|nr:hypothetical protein [Victivallales bacterium]